MANECIPLFRPGADLTCVATANVVGKTFANITSAAVIGNPVTPTDSVLTGVATCAAAAKPIGVFTQDAASGVRVPVILAPGQIVPVTCGAAVTAGVEVEVGANGKAITLAAGKAAGRAFSTTIAADQDLLVRIY